MVFFNVAKIAHGAAKIVKGIAEGDGEEIVKGGVKVAKGAVGLVVGSEASDDDDDMDD